MISSRTNRCGIVLVLALMCSTAWAGEPNETPIHLTFEKAPMLLGPYSVAGMDTAWQPFAIRKPGYAVAIPLIGSTDFLPFPGYGSMLGFMGRDQYAGFAEEHGGLSEPQKAFLWATRELYKDPRSLLVLSRPDPNGPQRLMLYAVTEQDARKMAQAFFACARAEFREHIQGTEKWLRKLSEEIAQGKKRITEVEEQMAAAQKALEEVQRSVPYHSESEAHEAVAELDRMVTNAQVEIAGIKARIETIQGYQHGGPGYSRSEETLPRLAMIFIEESIALRGAQAREQMATTLRRQANRFIDLTATLARAVAEKPTLTASLEKGQKQLEAYQRDLTSAPEKEPRIPDKVLIYQVSWGD
jgi:hypothetical protein